METGIASQTGEGRNSVLIVSLVEESTANLFEVELEFLGQYVLDKGLDRDIVIATECCKIRICTRSFRS